ncbi:MAG: hypothetical protein HWN80_17550 [Candidatus Lokiarchaeota archaeon]|nr:hypothetical protein [Candidatus Lokiarchaeota archaeon]
MRDIIFSINLGLIGTEDSRLEIFIDYLKEKSLKFTSENLVYEFFLQHEGIPIKLRIAITNSFENLIQRNEQFKHFDAIVIAVNLYNSNSISNYTIQSYSDFRSYFIFNGISVLVGVDTSFIFQKEPPNERKITEFSLIQKTKELEFLYCFKVQDKKKDITNLFDKVLNYINLKLKFLNPELFKRVNSNSEESNGRKSL